MAKDLTQLTALTTTADSDLVHVNRGGTDYKQAKIDFMKGDLSTIFSFSPLLTAQVDSMDLSKTYLGYLWNYGHVATSGVPIDNLCYIKVLTTNSNLYSVIEVWSAVDPDGQHYIICKNNGTWESAWTKCASKAEITSINNTLTESSVSFTKHASITGEQIQCNKLANVLYISGYFKVSSTVSSGAVLLDIPSISNYVLQYIFIHNASNQVSARLETASNSGHLCIKASTAISGSEYHYISCAIVL